MMPVSKAAELARLGSVFKVSWLRKRGVVPWGHQESLEAFIQRVLVSDTRQERPWAPRCAAVHVKAREMVPVDWPHVIWMIHQIRFNLFHGGKDYDSRSDNRFVELAYEILWRVWGAQIPPEFAWRPSFA